MACGDAGAAEGFGFRYSDPAAARRDGALPKSALGASMRALITGSHGFVGSHVVELLLERTDWELIGLDSFRHAGDSERNHADARYKTVCHDLNAPIRGRTAEAIGQVDYILNLASMSCVDTSIKDPVYFWENNTRLIVNILEYARRVRPRAFIHCSTDEVFGPSSDGEPHKEWAAIVPSNPYSASKAAQEALCIAYWRTFGVPLIITNTMNMLGRTPGTHLLPADPHPADLTRRGGRHPRDARGFWSARLSGCKEPRGRLALHPPEP